MLRFLTTVLTLMAGASAAVHDIDVGKGASLSFAPDTLTAGVGDTLNFHFYSGSGGHSVVSGPFSTPCEPASNAFFSGYIKGDDTGDQTFVVTVNSTDPIWFYCSLGSHCMAGMVGVVNPPSDQTVSSYVENASGTRASAPAALQGGVLTTISPGSGSTVTSIESTTVSSSSTPGLSAETTMPTTTGTSASAATTSKTSSTLSTSSGVAATSTPSGGGKNKDVSVMLGLGVGMMGFVALMA